LLEYSPSRGWLRDADDPLFENLLIVDESSMLDARLAYRLVSAIGKKMHVCFVGDVDQLPSVGAGTVLRDIIKSRATAVVSLDTIFRHSV
jgi:exodeoxyribonuclease V alpha subunit